MAKIVYQKNGNGLIRSIGKAWFYSLYRKRLEGLMIRQSVFSRERKSVGPGKPRTIKILVTENEINSRIAFSYLIKSIFSLRKTQKAWKLTLILRN